MFAHNHSHFEQNPQDNTTAHQEEEGKIFSSKKEGTLDCCFNPETQEQLSMCKTLLLQGSLQNQRHRPPDMGANSTCFTFSSFSVRQHTSTCLH